jgi:hypothetical protein
VKDFGRHTNRVRLSPGHAYRRTDSDSPERTDNVPVSASDMHLRGVGRAIPGSPRAPGT